MKKLFFLHFGARIEPGINKKIDAQIKELGKYLDVIEITVKEKKEHFNILEKIHMNLPILYSNKYNYDAALSEIEPDSIVYIRRNKADKYYVDFLKRIREKKCKVIIEVPTYPYFKDDFSKIKYWPAYLKEHRAIHQFKKYVDRFVTYSNDNYIFDVPTIKVKNGIYVDQIEERKPTKNNEKVINILAVATFRKQHGYERIIEGIYDYYSKGGKQNIVLRMVGEGEERKSYEELVQKLGISSHVLFLGRMIGDELSRQYDIADIALGAFGLYKLDVYNSSALKIREYLAKGLPIVSGCHEDAFEDEPFEYYLEFANDDSVTDVEKIVSFYHQIYDTNEDGDNSKRETMVRNIRDYARRHINYDVVFKNVIEYIKEVE